MHDGEIRLERGSALVAGNGIIQLAEIAQHDAEIEMQFGKTGIQGQRLAIPSGRLLELALPFECNAQYVVGDQCAGIGFDQCLGGDLRLCQLPGIVEVE